MKKGLLSLIIILFTVFLSGCDSQKKTPDQLLPKETTREPINAAAPQPIKEQPSEQSPVVEKKTVEVYDLRERCGKSSEEYFRNRLKEEGSYTCHYNRKLNKCFVRSFTGSGEKLIDIQENKIYGKCSYAASSCYFYDNENMIRNEWEKLINTFMEE